MDMFCYCVCRCHNVMSVCCSFVVTCGERADILAFVYVVFSCVFVNLPFGVLSNLCYLIVLIPDLCFLIYLEENIHP